jgi:hypothetical protein
VQQLVVHFLLLRYLAIYLEILFLPLFFRLFPGSGGCGSSGGCGGSGSSGGSGRGSGGGGSGSGRRWKTRTAY